MQMYDERFQGLLLEETAVFYEAEGERLMQVGLPSTLAARVQAWEGARCRRLGLEAVPWLLLLVCTVCLSA